MPGPAPAASASGALAFARQRDDCRVLVPFIEHQSSAPQAAPDASALKDVTAALRRLLRLTAMRVGEEALANARMAAQMAVQGLAAALPPADVAGEVWRGALYDLCAQLRQLGRWELLDTLAAGPCTPLFDGGEAGLCALEALARDKDGRWRLPATLTAVARRQAAAGDIGAAASLLAVAHTEAGKHLGTGCDAAAPVAHVVAEALASAAGAAWLASLTEERALTTMCAALFEHRGLEHSARLLVVLQAQPACPPPARRVLAVTLAKQAAAPELHALCASLPGFHAALSAMLQELRAEQAAGPPPPPDQFGWALPEPLTSQFRCSRAAGSGDLCHACQPLAAFMRSRAMETAPIIRVAEGDADADLEHMRGMLAGLQQRCPALPAYLQHRTFLTDPLAQGGARRRGAPPQRPVAAARLWKVTTWHQERVAVHRSAREDAARLQALLAGAPEPAPAVEPAAQVPAGEGQQAAAMEVDPAPPVRPTAAQPARPALAAALAGAAKDAAAPVPAQAHAAKVASPAAASATAKQPAKAKAVAPAPRKPAQPASSAAGKAPAPGKRGAVRAPAPAQAASRPDAGKPAPKAVPAPKVRPPSPASSKQQAAPASLQEAAPEQASQPADLLGNSAAVPAPSDAAAAAAVLVSPAPAAAPASSAAGTPAAAGLAAPTATAAAAQLLVAATPSSTGAGLIQCTLTADGKVTRIPPAVPSQASGRRASLAPASASHTVDSRRSSTAKKRPAAGSTAKKAGGPGSRIRASLRKQASKLKLPTLLRWFKPDSQEASLEGRRLAVLFEAEAEGAGAERGTRTSKRSRRR